MGFFFSYGIPHDSPQHELTRKNDSYREKKSTINNFDSRVFMTIEKIREKAFKNYITMEGLKIKKNCIKYM